MEDDEGGLPKLSKRFADKATGNGGGEVDYKTISGTAWSHSYLNQKPWHPLSYPNQRRKWIAEQTHAQRQRRLEEVTREYTQEQEFLRQRSLLSEKDKEKVDIMQAVSFMYVRPPGYNAECAKAAEIVDEKRKLGDSALDGAASSSVPQEAAPVKEEKKKSRPKDVFGRALPTEEEFAVLKNAPRLETGVAGRAKPFAVEVRNVKCVRCGTFGHQSGDRECPLKDVIMPNEESRLKRDDPLTTIMAQVDTSERLHWELKQKPGISPPRGGFQPDDPNQQIVAEDIFHEYGGFLSGGIIPELLSNFSSKQHKKKKTKHKSKHKKRASQRRGQEDCSSDSDDDHRSPKTKSKSKKKESSYTPRNHSVDYTSDSDNGRRSSKVKLKSKHRHRKQKSADDTDEDGSSYRDDDRKSRKTKGKSKHKEASTRPRKQDDDYTSDSDNSLRISETKFKSKHRHRKQGSVTDSDDQYGRSDRDDDLRGTETKNTSQQKEASTRPRKHGDDYSSNSDDDRRRSSKRSISDHSRRKQGSFPDNDDDWKTNDNRRLTRERIDKSEKNEKHRSHDRMSERSDDDRSQRHSFMKCEDDRKIDECSRRSRKEHLHTSKKDSSHSDDRCMDSDDRYRYCHSPTHSELKNHINDRSLDNVINEGKARRKSKRNRKHKSSRSDSDYSSSDISESDRRRQKQRHRYQLR